MKKNINHQFLKTIGLSFLIVSVASCTCFEKNKITESEILQAQETWGNEVVAVGKAYTDGENYKKAATELVDDLYAYQTGQVLFKPTKVYDIKFRTTKEGAVSYFVGHNKKFPEDKGFALEPWTDVRFENAGITTNNDVAIAMGNYFFTPKKGEPVKVEYTFGYLKNKDGRLKIVLHHSSLPYVN
jgi:hypothetical protein